MGAKINRKELDRFRENMEKLRDNMEGLHGESRSQFMRQASNRVAAEFLLEVEPLTPKDGGTLIRNWTVGETKQGDDTTETEVINPTEYASYVEYGHRKRDHKGWVKGKFFLTTAEQRARAKAPAILQTLLDKFIEGAINP